MAERDNDKRDDPDNPNIFASLRAQMVHEQLVKRGIADERVLHAMATVRREEFVFDHMREDAYNDSPLPIGFGQTISQPYAVAFVAEAARLTGEEKVLEVGTGCGYQAAVLAHLARTVHSVERIPELAKMAKQNLTRLGYDNVHVHVANGSLGLPDDAPFDAILVAASAEDLPMTLAQQLREGGRILIPIGPQPNAQRMMRYTRRDGKLIAEDLGGFSFVPLIGEFGWGENERER